MRSKLGQHYLIDSLVINRIIASASITPNERVLEIGTGKGALTKELCHLGKSFEGYEVDRDNISDTLLEIVTARETVHLGDAFKKTPRFDVLVSSLPYSRSTTFIEWISQMEYNRAVVLLQEDFVKKIMATPGDRDYRAISAIAQISSEFRVLMSVGKRSFSPPPRVNSLMVLVKPKTKLTRTEILKIRRFFSLRRKKVISAAAKLGIILHEYGFAGDRRVYSLTPEEVLGICGERNADTSEKRERQPHKQF